MSPVNWKGNKYIWSSATNAWYGYFREAGGDDYPGNNIQVPICNWGRLFGAAAEQGISITRKSVTHDSDGDDDTITVKRVNKSKSKKSEKKFTKSISIFGE